MIRRRDFITLIGGAAATRALAARAAAAGGAGDRLHQGHLGGRFRKTGGGTLTHELVGLQPDTIVTNGTLATAAVQRETHEK